MVEDPPRRAGGVARLGVDPLSDEFTVARLRAILDAAGRSQVKGVLRDQSVVAGIGNAYSDEVLHVARLSPFHPSTRSRTTTWRHSTRRSSVPCVMPWKRSAGLAAGDVKDSNARGCGCTGAPASSCPVCGDTVREVSFADSSLQYCPTCQTGGKHLADRRLSRLLK